MANTVRVFDFKINVSGVSVVGAGDDGNRSRLCPGCMSDVEVDTNIQLLKDDLDAIAVRMKKTLRNQQELLLPVSKNASRS